MTIPIVGVCELQKSSTSQYPVAINLTLANIIKKPQHCQKVSEK